jgi:ribosome-associated toxin RatA of RatAB toxin-antitoxin module
LTWRESEGLFDDLQNFARHYNQVAMALRVALFGSIVMLLLGDLRADLLGEVPKVARDELADGQLVVMSNAVEGAPWPRLKLYQVVDAPPKVVADLFSDYAAAPTYIPGMLGAKVIANNPDGTKDVQYRVKVPVLQSISYTVRNTYTQKGNSYEVKWTLIHSPLAKSSDGSLRIEPYGKGKTLMCYTNLCVPITNLVAGLKDQALKEAKSTVRAIATEAKRRAATQG